MQKMQQQKSRSEYDSQQTCKRSGRRVGTRNIKVEYSTVWREAGRKEEDIISRLRFGHTGLNTMNIVGKHERGLCDQCQRRILKARLSRGQIQYYRNITTEYRACGEQGEMCVYLNIYIYLFYLFFSEKASLMERIQFFRDIFFLLFIGLILLY